jgi:cobalt-zinc-cadmium efflux system membrane fusion protein
MTKKPIIVIVVLIAIGVGGYYAFSGKSENMGDTATKEEPAKAEQAEAAARDSTEISAQAATEAGIVVENTGPATVHETVSLTGRITLNQNATGQVKARFPGIVRSVNKGQGEGVKIGDVMATVESNDSLQVYPIKSPINGIVLARNTNVGDVAGDTPLFTVANVSNIWAEFHVFPRDINRIRDGQEVTVTSFEGHHTGKAPITVVLPLAEASSQTVVARVTLPNTERLWHSGMTVRGDVAVKERPVALAVKTSALQRMEGKSVVFVQAGERYSMRPIKTGLSDSEWTEVREGLKPGEAYVSQNSFMIKADIGKAGAEHED